MDATNLPLLVISQGTPGDRIEQLLPEFILECLISCIQRKGWMNFRTMEIWYDYHHKSCIARHDGDSELIFDDFKCHRSSEFMEEMLADNAHRYMITLYYIEILHPCDVGINKPLKDGLKKQLSNCRSEKFLTQIPVNFFYHQPGNKSFPGSEIYGRISDTNSKEFFFKKWAFLLRHYWLLWRLRIWNKIW